MIMIANAWWTVLQLSYVYIYKVASMKDDVMYLFFYHSTQTAYH